MNENRPDAITKKFPSGFTISVVPLPPYYMDVIKRALPEREYPERKIKNAFGDEFTVEYTLPKEEPSASDRSEYDLYWEWKSVEHHNKKVERKRKISMENFLLSMCVDVVDGPISIDSDEWVERLEAPFATEGFEMPEHPGVKRILFLKSVVITRPEEKEWLLNVAVYQEVEMQDIADALHNFPLDVGQALSV